MYTKKMANCYSFTKPYILFSDYIKMYSTHFYIYTFDIRYIDTFCFK